MGWERKRGKLHELNRLLRGATDTTFASIDNHSPVIPAGIRYIITLDADTRLPRGGAKRLIGKMAHPLNHPVLDPDARWVVDGHAVLQPRVSPSMPIGHEGSFYQRVFSNASGLDPYAFAVSDVYQDLFGEGSYSGKGIYDIDFFEAALEARILPDRLLSHDLFEGIFARAGLVSDIEVVEEFPSRYDVAAARLHRWTRGDWQLLPWIFGRRRPTVENSSQPAMPAVGRWKMIDNLRRSLSSPATLVALLAGWTLPLAAAEVWSSFVLLAVATPALLPFFIDILPRTGRFSRGSRVRAIALDLKAASLQVALVVALLPHQAWLITDAIVRTLFRLFVSHRMLLEWVTAAQAKIGPRLDLLGFYRQMVGAIVLACGAMLLVAWARPSSWPIALPFVAVWLLSPAIARWVSLPPVASIGEGLADPQRQVLRSIARRTWRFFDTFVTPADHMLPPDNFQDDPAPVLAHRTSPTNLGLYLLSVVAARDFGWIGTAETTTRLEATLESMNTLERFRGHFYNWYGTLDLRPLEPKYISSVDSGNLAGHLIALWNACGEMVAHPVMGPQCLRGIADSLDLMRQSLSAFGDESEASRRKPLSEALDVLSALLRDTPATATGIAVRLNALAPAAQTAADRARSLLESRGNGVTADDELPVWANAIYAAILSHQEDLDLLMPWAGLIARDSAAIASEGTPLVDEQLGILLAAMPTLADLPRICEEAVALLTRAQTEAASPDSAPRNGLIDAFKRSAHAAASVATRLAALGELARRMFFPMEFDFLFDRKRELLSIGYQVAEGCLDPSYYDLLASEARLASFVAIAKGDIPTRHWFRLGRALAPVGSRSALVSWSGSMFEYLMPSLVMRAPAGSLLEQTSRQAVRRQITYGAARGVPWGISESAFNARDLELTYQYSSFGVPDLGLKRGLGDNIVIAPYATALAAMVDPAAALQNFQRLAEIGGTGSYGWYDALDYTKARLPDGVDVAIVHAYMAHHQGMSLVAIADTLHAGAMRARFHAEPIIQATELLLQERMPRDVAIFQPRIAPMEGGVSEPASATQRRFTSPHDLTPRTHLLSNGRYSVMMTAAGSGYSRWGDFAITRWREDVTCDGWGTYVFLRDTRSGALWSAGYQPSGAAPDRYDVAFSEGRAEIVRHDEAFSTTTEVLVSSEDDAEVRRVSITNLGSHIREIELTSYAEIALAPRADDDAHPAFSKLFVETEFVAEIGAILATRRPRSPDEARIWVAHLAVIEGEAVGDVQFETDRARFLGRGRGIRRPIAMVGSTPLSNTVGTVLDPIVSLRRRVRIQPQATARVAFWTLVASSRSEALDLVDKHHEAMAFERAGMLAWTQAQVQLHHLGVTAGQAHVFQRLANRVLYADPTLRPPSDTLKLGAGAAPILWPQGISGDLPIVLVRIDDIADIDVVRQLLLAHEYWRMKLLSVDLVILNDRSASYVQDLQIALEALGRAVQSRPTVVGDGIRGAVFILRRDRIAAELRQVLQTAARVVLVASRGSLDVQVTRVVEPQPAVAPPRRLAVNRESRPLVPQPVLEFFNGLGGFADDGREYRTILGAGQSTPAPWINVVSNRSFGFQSSADGSGSTWSLNSQQNHITPWSNDPVTDAPGEVLYLRDEDNGDLWGPTALPIRVPESSYVARHGRGHSRFEHISHGVSLELLQYVPLDDSIKISRLKITDLSGRARHLSVTAYVEWVLGASRGASAPFIVTEIDAATGAMFARNPWNTEFGRRVAFIDLAGKQMSWTGDRTVFLGRNGALDQPASLADAAPLSKRTGAGLDPCGALQTRLDLKANGSTEIVFLLGDAATAVEAQSLVKKYRTADLDAVLAAVVGFWDETLGAVRVTTPDRAMDILLNGWLLYQTLACRVWARAAFYQASGAYGFRDQLQDAMALCIARPEVAREHLLRAAARQFLAGDVQHWWLPESGKGIRTRVADDPIWLAYVVAHYIAATGDHAVLDEKVPFLEGPALHEGEVDAFFQPALSDNQATLFEHCARGLDHSLAVGSHGLPLMGTGDWNDGMNRVGDQGKGESIWLGWFLHAALTGFAPLADSRNERARAEAWRSHRITLQESLTRDGWDGAWYRRAYFDDGTPLGSAANDECRIDSIAQSWSVISGAAAPIRAAQAMEAVEQQLVRRDDALALLFAPPFDQTQRDPGYIKGYPPGIRENGGQYTHGALWSVIAFAMLGDGDKAGELFSMLNPINHARTPDAVQRYKVEPYVACADVYSVSPHVGRGGWTWYTGSAGWMYRAGLEWILGFRLQGTSLLLDPCIPKTWPDFTLSFRYRSSRYDIAVSNPDGVSHGVICAELDGAALPGNEARIPLKDDGATHRVRVVLG
jgi:cyclic beta-1,2-glucan synthetase